MSEAKPVVSQGRGFSAIWIIPVVALLLGAYMVVHTIMTEGPEITVSFENGDGLEAGKTKLKLRNVTLGVVQDIALNETLDGVVATIKLERDATDMLREDTRFWVVRARIGGGSISGLGTLLSGAYIEISPGSDALPQRDFVGLEEPPLTASDAPGVRIELFSDRATSVSAGDPVLYRGYKVGRVESKRLDPDAQKVKYDVFVDAPFDKLVTTSVRFYDISGFSLFAGADGFKVETGSADTILLGGVTFDLPPGFEPGEPASSMESFKLYESYDDITRNPFEVGKYYVTSFSQSIGGLSPDAPVRYRGIRIGRVVRVMFKEMTADIAIARERGEVVGQGSPIPVLVYLEPGRLEWPDTEDSNDLLHEVIKSGIPNGMRATLNTGNLLTGAQYVELDYYDDQKGGQMSEQLGYPFIPSIEGGLGQITHKLSAVLDKVNGLPLETTVANANAAIAELDKTLAAASSLLSDPGMQKLPADLSATVEELQEVLSGFAPGSDFYRNLDGSIGDLNRMLQNLESLTRTLAVQPNAAIMPVELPADPEPEAP